MCEFSVQPHSGGRPQSGSFSGPGKSGVLVSLLIAAALMAGCGSQPVAQETVDAQSIVEQRSSRTDINNKLASLAASTSVSDDVVWTDYPIGGGDVLEISVFGVPELNNTKVRVSRQGTVMLPLVGELDVEGRSPRNVENLLVERLTEFMHKPEVSVFVAEYHSQEVSVTGAVNRPAVHSLTRPRSVLELVSMSGGLSEQAGGKLYVHTKADNAAQRLIIDLDEVLSDPDNGNLAILLSGGDSVFVPEAGAIFVEGAVNSPGSYPLRRGAGILEAIAMARGTRSDARESDIQVFTSNVNGERTVVAVSLDRIRANDGPNYELQDGDIVVVPSNAFQRGFTSFWNGFRGIFGMGYSINGP